MPNKPLPGRDLRFAHASEPPRAPGRPAGITVLSLLTGWLALAGFANAAVFLAAPEPREIFGIAAPAMALAALVYGATAAAASAGLWRMRAWAPRAYLVWIAAVVAAGATFLWSVHAADFELPEMFAALAPLFIILLAALLSLPVRYIRRQLRDARF